MTHRPSITRDSAARGKTAATAYCLVFAVGLVILLAANALASPRFSAGLVQETTQGSAQDKAQNKTEDTAKEQQAHQLVQQLSADKFQIREQASRELAAFGMSAAAALKSGIESGDAEVRARCLLILRDITKRDFQARLQQFKADLDGTSGYGLPGFDIYAESIGNTRAARELYADMLETTPGLMHAITPNSDELSSAVDQQIDAILNYDASIMDSPQRMASLLFASSLDGVSCETTTLSMISFVTQTRPFGELARGPHAEVCHKIMDKWLGYNYASAPTEECLRLALEYKLPAGMPLAKSVAVDKSAKPTERMYAILAVAQLGDATHIPMLQKLFDAREVTRAYTLTNGQWEAQLRDIALASVLYLAGEDPKDFGFVNCARSDITLFRPDTLSFAGERERQMAFAKYHARFGQTDGNGN